jgi:hypothetical protein
MVPLVVVAMWTAVMADAYNNAKIELRCHLVFPSAKLEKRLKKEFCAALAGSLSEELGVGFVLAEVDGISNESGRVLDVDVRFLSEHHADVTTSLGRIESGKITLQNKKESKLESQDQPLGAESSRALVRLIGLQMGLID